MRQLRKILYPFSLLYGGILRLRNYLYNHQILESRVYDFPVICVGNLSMGGTGKSPMIEYLVRLLATHYRLGTLSRGYKRKTKGFVEVSTAHTALEVGDEPLQFKRKFESLLVAVCEDRRKGIEQMRKRQKTPEVILLDDAFQHRRVQPNLSILLSAYNDLYTQDCVLPAGNLREPKVGARRAQLIVVTKCPVDLSKAERQNIIRAIQPNPDQLVFFSSITYADQVTNGKQHIPLQVLQDTFTLVTGIAKPKPLVEFLKAKGFSVNHKQYQDHHNFSRQEIETLEAEPFIITTEKDFVRLRDYISPEKLFYLPIKMEFIADAASFDQRIKKHVQAYACDRSSTS